MPDIFRYPRIIFPDLAEHQLFTKFQPRDRDYIIPAGETFFVPFDASYLDVDDKLIMVPYIVAGANAVRVPRVHLWLEPCDKYPRGTRIIFRVFISSQPYDVTVYVGRYYIIPVSSFTLNTVGGDIEEKHVDDMWLRSSGYIRMRFYKSDSTLLPNYSGLDLIDSLPSFSGLLEVE